MTRGFLCHEEGIATQKPQTVLTYAWCFKANEGLSRTCTQQGLFEGLSRRCTQQGLFEKTACRHGDQPHGTFSESAGNLQKRPDLDIVSVSGHISIPDGR